MKKMLYATTLIACTALACILGCSGCKADKINVIYHDTVITNTVPVKAFNDESYVWEGWQFSTNKVDKLD